MVLFFTGTSYLQPSKLPLVLFQLSLVFLLLVPCSNSLSFNISSFDQKPRDIVLTGDANFSKNGVELTNNQQNSRGRATYKDSVRLWDKETRNLTDFTTRFSLTIATINNSLPADGLAFFLATSNGSEPPPNSAGSCLGLLTYDDYLDKVCLNNTDNQLIAVEFDTYCDDRVDPLYNHVGIDLNSIKSVETTRWYGTITNIGSTVDVRITYNSSTQNLSVFLAYPEKPVAISNGDPDLSYKVDMRKFLPEWVTIGFSAATGLGGLETHQIHSWEFYSSMEVETKKTNSSMEVEKKKTNNTRLFVGLFVGAGTLMVLGTIFIWLTMRMKRKRDTEEVEDDDDDSMNDEFEKGAGPKRFLYGELARATNDFHEEQKLGEGGFGGVYRGLLSDVNLEVAVKRVSKRSKQGIKEYTSEVKIISRLRHKNLVQLVGWCHQRKEFLLVYEFLPNGSLDSHLFGQKESLTWKVRYDIALDLASALLYLQEEWEQCVFHRDIKSSNVMLDSNFNAKLGDFGLARLVDHGQRAQTTVLAGTMGYMAPECVITGKSSKESDVYSYGIVALEIACGRRPVEPRLESSKVRLVEWVWELYGRGMLFEAADSRLKNTGFDEKQMECLMVVGLWCAHPDSNLRPSIKQAMQVLNFEAPLPTLPPKMPIPTYCVPQFNACDHSNSSDVVFPSTNSCTISLMYPR
ncbi:PREDICTED: L-type lectin-domain containing receptor kinase IX.1-like [Nelumbo nucifera]|uniref:non-specific serine/threonine protein kinase n=2 Tax=Nelumbo nucifera TaxID=4432 RepID=A0A1U8B3B6_NELNU|nr:PREDICTED: L-type lectin-domain containing receptor kinase IX.1-like [Nelumbo nucifera]DAD45415.1 TPA_asm: hypothetical protein HUJ06_003645 [Nelumbo nucifera]